MRSVLCSSAAHLIRYLGRLAKGQLFDALVEECRSEETRRPGSIDNRCTFANDEDHEKSRQMSNLPKDNTLSDDEQQRLVLAAVVSMRKNGEAYLSAYRKAVSVQTLTVPPRSIIDSLLDPDAHLSREQRLALSNWCKAATAFFPDNTQNSAMSGAMGSGVTDGSNQEDNAAGSSHTAGLSSDEWKDPMSITSLIT